MFSYLQSIDNDTKSVFAEAFGQLPQRVIWKMDGTPPANLPDNVKVAKWIPQNDILGRLYNARYCGNQIVIHRPY